MHFCIILPPVVPSGLFHCSYYESLAVIDVYFALALSLFSTTYFGFSHLLLYCVSGETLGCSPFDKPEHFASLYNTSTEG